MTKSSIPGVRKLAQEAYCQDKIKVKKAPFIVLEDKNDIFKSRIQINDNQIKHALICFNSYIILNKDIINLKLSEPEIERAEASSRYNILDLINDGKANEWFEENGSDDLKDLNKTLLEFETKFQSIFLSAKESDNIQFNLLPYFIHKNETIAIKKDNTWIGIKVTKSKMKVSWMGPYFKIEGTSIHFDGKNFTKAVVTHLVYEFDDAKQFPEIGIKLLSKDKELQKNLIERGKKYEKIHSSGPAYLFHTGAITRKNWITSYEYPATGRVVVDRLGMMNIDPNYEKYFGQSYNEPEQEINTNFVFTDELYMITSPFCYGFSFIAKQWGELHIDNLSEISFRTDSYDKLVLDEDVKNILFSLTENNEQGKDIIDGKGGGCIFLLHGSPGVGKTLSAETIAETLKRPLYMVSVGELGTDITTLEENLKNILYVSASWNAVLLIDEVDIFLEKRDLDIHRNALVGVFLRLLEYYTGILFLTTNRVTHIDPAFYSRISLAIMYPQLSVMAKTKIWDAQLGLYNIKFPEEELTSLSQFDLNGRQIKNCIRIAKSLADKNNLPVTKKDMLSIISRIEDFNIVLKEQTE